jgi:hypothetical protein
VRSVRELVGTLAPLDQAAEYRFAAVVWVSVLSLSLKFRRPETAWRVVEPVVFAVSLKEVVAAGPVKFGA